jgi:hypothetical protein
MCDHTAHHMVREERWARQPRLEDQLRRMELWLATVQRIVEATAVHIASLEAAVRAQLKPSPAALSMES